MSSFKTTVSEMRNLYLNDRRPWIVGFSGGKDSTCVAQLVYYMLTELPPKKRKKTVHIVSADTLVESPLIELRIKQICSNIQNQASRDRLPIKVKLLRPRLEDTFWVNLIGRGYPSPNRWFRWCTDRLKIDPMTRYAREQVQENGEVTIVLGARKDESGSRAQTMAKYEIEGLRLRRHSSIAGAYIYAPIEDWDYREVWAYLLQAPSPWGDDNRNLLSFYRKIDRECPLVVDKSTPPCGGSRFGCWVCTVVERDRAMEGLIEDGEEWLQPLLDFRNWLKKIRDDSTYRQATRKNQRKKKLAAETFGRNYIAPVHRGHRTLGPFTFKARHEILRRLIALQEQVTPRGIRLISPEEIRAIETVWIYEGDNISSIADVVSVPSVAPSGLISRLDGKNGDYTRELASICRRNGISPSLVEKLLIVEKDLSRLSRRVGIHDRLEAVLGQYVANEWSGLG